MTILREILEEIESDSTLEKMMIICDQIFEEEKENIEHIDILPKGPNIFLSLEVPGRITNEVAFLSLERDLENTYIIVLFVTEIKQIKELLPEDISIKRQKVWQIMDHRPEKILTEYAKKYKLLRGQ